MAELHVAHLGALERIGEEEAEATVSSVAASPDDAWQPSSAEPLAAPPSEGAFRWRRQEAEALRKLHTHLQCLNELLTFAPDEQKRLRVQLQQAQLHDSAQKSVSAALLKLVPGTVRIPSHPYTSRLYLDQFSPGG